MTRATRALAAGALLGAALTGCGGGGGAAAPVAPAVPDVHGTVTYRLADGSAAGIEHPVHGLCVAFAGPAASLENRTDATAHLRDGCAGPDGDVVLPGTTWARADGAVAARAVVLLRH